HRFGVAVRGHWFGVSIRLNFNRRAAVAEGPLLLARLGAEGPHFERDRIAWFDSEGRRVGGMDGGREFFRMRFVDDLHHGEVVINPAFGVHDFEHFAVASRAIKSALDLWSFGGAAIAEGPLEGWDLSRGSPGT